MRVEAVAQAAILALLATIVLTKAGFVLPSWAANAYKLIWVAVAFAAVGTVLNVITPSKWEWILWAPVAAMLLVTSVAVALA